MATSRRRAAAAESSAGSNAGPTGGSTAGASAAAAAGSSALPRRRVLKKYPNRRLYDTQSSSYITLQDVKDMVLQAADFEVQDAKTGEDITRSILLQIILEEETGGVPMFSSAMLANIIRFYGHSMQGMMGHYLEHNLQAFADLQRQWSEQSKPLYDPANFNAEAWTQWTKLFQPVAGLPVMPGFPSGMPGFPPTKK